LDGHRVEKLDSGENNEEENEAERDLSQATDSTRTWSGRARAWGRNNVLGYSAQGERMYK
jgi:hypothetical protein